jgi:drug/metabolite transporter (DMT)-like permease
LVYALLSKVISKSAKYGSPISFNFWLHVVALIGLSFVVDFHELKRLVLAGDTKFWLNMLYFGVINSSIATTTYFYATTKLGAEKASSFIFIVPSAAVLFSWLLMDETIEIKTIVGGTIAILAVFIINGKLNIFGQEKSPD